MARSIQDIAQQMLDAKAEDSNLSGLTSTSQTSIWRLWIFIVAAAYNVFEQLMDLFKVEIETTVENNYVGTPKWIRQKCLEFQYSAVNPQVLEITDNTKIAFPVIDTSLRIVTRASVTTDLNKIVKIKVAKGEQPTQLVGAEPVALQAYLSELVPAGVYWELINAVSDKLFIEGEVFYDGQYSATIQANVEAGINAYLAGIDFDGLIKIVDLETSIRQVTGVKDLKLKNVWLRANSIPLSNGFKMIDTFTLVIISAVPYAGYAVEETTEDETWEDKITYTIL
jgi:hypothetical protein